eukprot:193306-Chlamydomonas_euryale.AAC.1
MLRDTRHSSSSTLEAEAPAPRPPTTDTTKTTAARSNPRHRCRPHVPSRTRRRTHARRSRAADPTAGRTTAGCG